MACFFCSISSKYRSVTTTFLPGLLVNEALFIISLAGLFGLTAFLLSFIAGSGLVSDLSLWHLL
jgi:hypothetical protein